jgi:ferredoxin
MSAMADTSRTLLDRLIRPSTRAFWREGRALPGYSVLDWLHGYAYARWPYAYISLALGEHPLCRALSPVVTAASRFIETTGGGRFADTYHGKALPTEAATKLIRLERPLDLTLPEQVVPYAMARDIVLSGPAEVVALECPCRASRESPCLPLDVCLIVGKPFTDFIVEHHPRRARRIGRDEAADILAAERDRGHVHHAFFKDAMLGRFYAVCNCCSCCCGAMQAQREFGVKMLCSSGYVCAVGEEACRGCGRCAEVCPFGAVAMSGGVSRVDRAACLGCGVCVAACEAGALSLERDPERGAPLDVDRLGR